jgi:ribonuclease HII
MDVSTLSLAALEARARGLRDEAALLRMAEILNRDRRAGARLLSERCRHRATRRRRERLRGRRLLALRGRLVAGGARLVAGVDEVGMGPLAGPVVAAAVVLPDRIDLPGLDDSKRVSARARERLAESIACQAVAVSLATLPPSDVDRLNIYRAGLEAMRRAVLGLDPAPDHVLVDARTIPGIEPPQTPLPKGDSRDASIAAASIVAKVHRDRLMQELDGRYPGYGFARHKGYATAAHLAALRRLGPCPEHRRSFAPVLQPPLL